MFALLCTSFLKKMASLCCLERLQISHYILLSLLILCMFNVSVVSYASIVACVCSFLRYPLAVEVSAADMSSSLLAVRAVLKHSEHRVDQHTDLMFAPRCG